MHTNITPLRLDSTLLTATAQRREYQCRFVRAGRIVAADGTPGRIAIAAQALASAVAGGLFDNCAVFVDHDSAPEGPSLTRLVGVTLSSQWNEAEQAVQGIIRLYESPLAQMVSRLLDDLLAEPQHAPDVGLSLVFYPQWAPESQPGEVALVTRIWSIESIDLVFQPAAGGRVLEALSRLDENKGIFIQPDSTIGGITMSENVPTNITNPVSENAPPPGEVETWQAAAAASVSEAARRQAIQDILGASDLPVASRERLAEAAYSQPQELQQAIEVERAYLARLQADQVVQIGSHAPRGPQITLGRTSLEQVQAALDALMLGVHPPSGVQPLGGVRELYLLLSGDYDLTGVFQPERVYLGNVNSSTMAGMVANALNKVVANEFQQYPRWWELFTTAMDFASLQPARWIVLGGVGELPTVAEGAAYTELYWDDKTETASFVKKGGYLGLTIEAIDKDDTGRLRAAPRALAQAAWLALSKAISAIFTSNGGVGPTMSDSLALFHSSHGNLGSSALTLATWGQARTAMRQQTELNSGERLGGLTAPKYLLVPPELEVTALQIMGSGLDYSYALSNGTAAPTNVFAEGDGHEAAMRSARQRVIVVDLWTDSNNWAAVADPNLFPSIGVGFRYGRTPEIFSVASPTAGLMFTNDTMPIKVRFFFAAGPIDWKGLYKANVA